MDLGTVMDFREFYNLVCQQSGFSLLQYLVLEILRMAFLVHDWAAFCLSENQSASVVRSDFGCQPCRALIEPVWISVIRV